MNKLKFLCIDVGRISGWVFMSDSVVCAHEEIKFVSLNDYLTKITHLIREYKPDLIASARPTRHARVIAYQSKLLAIVELAAEKNDKPFYELIDSQCKKEVFGRGVVPKDEIIEYMRGKHDIDELSEHIADSMLFCEYLQLTVKAE